MLTDLLCVKEKVVQYQNPAKTAPLFTEWLKAGTWFGFAEVDIKISKHLWIKFEKKTFFFTKQIPDEAVPQHIKDYCERTGRTRGNEKNLVGALSVQMLFLFDLLLR